ncbi:alpha/beta hydrolase family protein [Streptomyces sp. NPDC048258]|uniref:alpha/beta hydrolase family protein n=1 Tax=Streptomyces sp. NPDC048258 TaxID=3365527 RepID=UPI003711C4AC
MAAARCRRRGARGRTGRVAAPAALAAPVAYVASASTVGAPASATARGALISVTPLDTLGRDQVVAALGTLGFDPGTVRYGVTAYRLDYATVDPQGRPTTAPGLLVLPRGGPHRLDLASDTHGTLATRDDAPSGGAGYNRLTPYLHASAGRAVAAPDYPGLGGGPGSHPYMDTRSAVTASVDMLKAARTAAGRLGRPVTRDVYATGFSQGGQVAMAVGRELSRGRDGLRLRALAPIAGPHTLSGDDPRPAVTAARNDLTAYARADSRPVAVALRRPFYRILDDLDRTPA